MKLLIWFMCHEDLHRRLYKWLLQLFIDSIKQASQITPVVNFAQDAFLWNSIANFLEKLSNGARPHVHVVLEDAELSRAKLLVHCDWVLHALATLYNLLSQDAKAFWLLNPLVGIAFSVLDVWVQLSVFVASTRALHGCSRGAWRSQGRSITHARLVSLGHTTTCHIEALAKLASRFGLCTNIFLLHVGFHIGGFKASMHRDLPWSRNFLTRWCCSRRIFGTGLADILDRLTRACSCLLLHLFNRGDDRGEELLRAHSSVEARWNYYQQGLSLERKNGRNTYLTLA